jgi:hypothetical protein
MPRYAANSPGNRELATPVPCGEAEPGFAAQRRWVRSSFEFVTGDVSSAPLAVRADAMSRGLPHVARYLFNSMPCAYAWFHH